MPELDGKLDGVAIRVPTPNVSVVDLTFESSKSTTESEINSYIENASLSEFKRHTGLYKKKNWYQWISIMIHTPQYSRQTRQKYFKIIWYEY